MVQMLELYGYEVDVASNGKEGVKKTQEWHPDVVLMDIRMPGQIDGLAAIRQLRNGPDTVHIPIIVVSAFGGARQRERALSAGANAHFRKPVSMDKLIAAINTYLDRSVAKAAPAVQGPDDRHATIVMLEFQVSLWRDEPALAAALEQLTSLTSGLIHDLRNSLGLLRDSLMLHNKPVLNAKADFCLHLLESMAALRFKSQASYDFHTGQFASPELSRARLQDALHGSEQRLLLVGRGKSITDLTIHGWLDDEWLYQGMWAFLWSLARCLSPEGKIEIEDRRLDNRAAGFHVTITTPDKSSCIQQEALQPEAVLSGDEIALGLFLMRKAVAFHKGQLTVEPGLVEIHIPATFWEELAAKDEPQQEIDRLEEEIAVRERSHEEAGPDITPLVRSFALPLLGQLDVIQKEVESFAGGNQDSKPWVTILRNCRYSQLLLWNLLWLGVGLEPPRKEVDVGETLYLVLGILDGQIRRDEIKVVTQVDKGLPRALADEVSLQQVFMNLILNALEAMLEEGYLTLRARQEDGMVVVEVSDTGHGIPPENLDKIYDIRFSTKEGRERGVGLYVVKSIVDRLGGQVEVESRLAEGTTFTVRLPVAPT
jgi:signal transduction histidine kinase